MLLLFFVGVPVRAQVIEWEPVTSFVGVAEEDYAEAQAARRAWFALRRGPARADETLIDLMPDADVRWRSGGPIYYSGRTLAHAFHPATPDTLWIGTDGGGVWRTDDGGRRWVPQTDFLPSLTTGCVAVRPAPPHVLLIGTNDTYLPDGGGVFRSADGGSGWEDTGYADRPTTCHALHWHPRDTSRVYMAVDGAPSAAPDVAGVWASHDAGRSWQRVLAGAARGLALLPATNAAPERLFAALADGSGRPGGVYRSTDDGRSWQRLDGGLPPPDAFEQSLPLGVSPADPDGLYALVQNEDTSDATATVLYHTADGGDRWRAIAMPDSANSVFPPGIARQAVDRESVWTLGVSPHDARVVFVGGVNLFRTTDGGTTWTWISKLHDDPTQPWYGNKPVTGPAWATSDTLLNHFSALGYTVHVDHQDVGFHPLRDSVVYSFNDGGVERTDDLGTTWLAADSALVTVEFYDVAATDGWVSGGAQDNGLLVRMGPHAWHKWETGDGMATGFLPSERGTYVIGTSEYGNYHTLFSQPLNAALPHGAAMGQPLTPTLWRSDVSKQVPGAPGTAETCPGLWSSPLAIDHHNPRDVFASDLCYVYRAVVDSMEATVHGIDEGLPAGIYLEAIHPIPNVSVLAVRRLPGAQAAVYAYAAEDSLLWRSSDGGATWDSVAADLGPVTDLAVDPSRPEVLYAVRPTLGAQVMRSADRGRTWAPIDTTTLNQLPPFPANTIVAVPDTAGTQLYVGMSRGVYVGRETAPGRFTWVDFSGNLPGAVVMDVRYRAVDQTIHVATFGRGYWWAPAYRPAAP